MTPSTNWSARQSTASSPRSCSGHSVDRGDTIAMGAAERLSARPRAPVIDRDEAVLAPDEEQIRGLEVAVDDVVHPVDLGHRVGQPAASRNDWTAPGTGARPSPGLVEVVLERLAHDPRLQHEQAPAGAPSLEDREEVRVVLGHATERAEMLLAVAAERQVREPHLPAARRVDGGVDLATELSFSTTRSVRGPNRIRSSTGSERPRWRTTSRLMGSMLPSHVHHRGRTRTVQARRPLFRYRVGRMPDSCPVRPARLSRRWPLQHRVARRRAVQPTARRGARLSPRRAQGRSARSPVSSGAGPALR